MARRPQRRKNRPQTPKPRKHETLEPRVVMSANPIGGPMMGHHSMIEEEPPGLSHHGMGPSMGSAIVETAPAVDPDADFWLDRGSDLDWDDLDAQFDQIKQLLNDAHDLTGQDNVVSKYGFDGGGQTVAVIDSGIAYSHYALGGGVGEGYRVVGGWDFTENDADFYDDGPEGSHGTHVAGIVGAVGDGAHSGVATGVDMVGLRVFDDAGNGYFSWVEQALQWVHTNRNAFDNPITAVNLSLGTEWNSDSVPSWAMLENEFAQLEAAGIFVSVSAGNSFASYNTKGVSYPAASDHVVPVMSVDNNGQLSYFSQRAEYAIAAPGRWITSTVPDYAANDGDTIDDDWLSMSGTSMAAPYVAGASMLIREAMEFVGQTGVDQWDIYDHMMATADTFYDSATDTNYKRLNLEAAIDALMPEDDFGSSVATAHNLGTLNDSSSSTPLSLVSGAITTLDDGDYFTFTAGVTGTVTVTASGMTHEMVAEWDAWGGAWNDQGNGSCVMDVVAGQTYTFALSTADGLGYYDLDINVESSFAAIEWGSIGAQETRNWQPSASEEWFAVTAGRTGYFTVESLPANGSATVAIYDAQQNLLAAAGSRADAQITAGETLMLRVTGDSTEYDLRLTNAVSVSGGLASAVGTGEADTLAFVAGGAEHTITLNGVAYVVDASEAGSILLDGAGGEDSVSISGTSANETAYVGVASAQLVSSTTTIDARSTETITIDGGGGSDTAILYGSSAADTFNAWTDRATMEGSGYSNEVNDFSAVHAFANDTADRAYLHGDAAADTFRSYDDRAILSGAGYYNRALGFSSVTAYGGGGNDTAWMYGSAGADEYRVSSSHAIMSGDSYENTAVDFYITYGFAQGAGDQAWMYGSDGADTYSTYDDRVAMAGSDYYNRASGFELTYGFANGADDTAWMFGSDGVDEYRTYEDRVVMSGTGYYNRAEGFARSWGFGTAEDSASMYDSAGLDEYRTSGSHAIMSGGSFYNAAVRFGATNGYATTFGDQAWMYGSSGDDTYSGYSDRVEMVGDGYNNQAHGFTLTYAFANGAGDEAYLYDSLGNDTFRSYADRSIMSSSQFYNRVIGFQNVTAYSTSGDDTATLYDDVGDDHAVVRSWGASLDYASGVRVSADGFDEVYADGSAGGSNTLDEVAVDYYFGEIGSWA